VVGRRRVRLLEVGDLDGYRVARAQPLLDEPPAEGDVARLAALAEQVSTKTHEVIERLRWVPRVGWGAGAVGARRGYGRAGWCGWFGQPSASSDMPGPACACARLMSGRQSLI
jgi:hypothetical protein